MTKTRARARIHPTRWRPEMTLGELGRRTGLTRQHLSRIINGHQEPSLRALRLMAGVLKMTLDELMGLLHYPAPTPR